MKRTLFIIVAALLVLLSYPSTYSHAGNTSTKQLSVDKPHVFVPSDATGTPTVQPDANSDDDGDADGVLGIRNNNQRPGGSASILGLGDIRTSVLVRAWWNYVMFLRF